MKLFRRRAQAPAPVSISVDGLPVVRVQHTIKHEPRPPAPRPERITVVYEMQDGREYRTFIPLHGQAVWVEAWPQWLDREQNQTGMPPKAIRYHLGYSDT